MKNEAKNTDLEKLSLEDALTELEGIVLQLENNEIALEDAIEKYNRGTAIKEICEKKLKDAELKIEKIVAHQRVETKENEIDVQSQK